MIKARPALGINWFDSKLAIISIVLLMSLATRSFGQCSAPPAPGYSNDPGACASSSIQLTVTTSSTGISGHRWYTSEFGTTQVNPDSQGNPGGYSGAWTSHYTISYNNPIQEYWVSSVWTQPGCSQMESSTRKRVKTVPANSGVQVTPNVPPYSLCVGDVITLTASGGAGGYSWSTGQSGTQISITASTSMTVTMTTTSSVCSGTTVPIEIPLTVGAKVGQVSMTGPASVCQGSTTTYNVSATNMNFYQWSATPSNAVSSMNNTTGQITWNPSFSGSATINVEAFSHGSCAVRTTTSLNVTVSAPPTTAVAPADITSSATCGLTSVALMANTPSIGTGAWSVLSGSGGSFSNASSPSTTFSGNQDVDYILRWTISNGACPTSFDDVNVRFHRPPTTANAGTDLNGLITCGVTSLALQGNSPSAGSGSWSIVSGAGGNISTPSNPNSTFSGVAGNTYTLQWSISKSPCATSTDQVIVTFNRFPSVANAGPDQTGSATCGQTSVTLAAASPAIGTGSWSVISGSGGSFGNSSAVNSSFVGTLGVNYTLRWTVTNNPCLSTTDDVLVRLNPLPAGTPTVANNARFGEGPLTLNGNGASGGETYEWNVAGNITTGTTRGVTSVSTNVTNYGTLTIVGTQGCRRSSAFNLYVHDNPVVSGSSSFVYLGTSATLSVGTYDSYLWSNAATTQAITTSAPGTYTVTVTKGSLSKTSDPFTLHTQLGGMNQNYVQALSPQVVGMDPSNILLQPIQNVSQNVQYFDGLGRPMQTVAVQTSPLKNDIVQPMVYDKFGREEKRYLPFAAENTGRYKDNTLLIDEVTGDYKGIAATFYDTPSSKVADDDDNLPFSKTVFEPSPLGRFIKQGAPGAAWKPDPLDNTYNSTDHTVKQRFETNNVNEVLNWTYTPPTGTAAFGSLDASSSYGNNELIKSSTKDENGKQVIEYVNHDGNVVLKRVQATQSASPIDDVNYASTYYVYDELRQLVCVIQPEGTKRITQTTSEYFGKTPSEKETFLQQWAFRYRYDNLKRMILKQVPGADSVRMVYDQRDRIVLTQDGNQRALNKWSFTKYDLLNRPILTGEYTHGSPQTQREMAAMLLGPQLYGETYNSTATTTHGYSTNTLVNFTGTFDVYSATYYDDHQFTALVTTPEFNAGEIAYLHNHLSGQYVVNTNKSFDRVRGQVTGSKTRILGSNTFLWSINYYDDRYRVVQNVSSNHKGGVDRATSVYDFTGKVMKTKMSHRVGSVTHTIEREFDYDHAGRLLKTWHKVDSRPKVILSAMEYNELGQLVTKKLHASADNSIDDEGTTYSPGVIEVAQYNNEKNIIGNTRVVLKPGFAVPAGKSFRASTENQWTPANSNPSNASYAQVVDYRYNIRGWMTKINDVDAPNENELFAMKLNYNSSTLGASYDQFNGNISQAIWSSSGLDKQAFGYKYDAMNRLLEGNYFNLVDGAKNGRYSEHIVGNPSIDTRPYDLNGNINGINRWGKRADGNFASMDELRYTYTGTGNRVTRIDDNVAKMTTEEGFKENVKVANEYDYDKNGNMKLDQNKGIQAIRYNMLNLPQIVKKNATDSLEYTYDATGRKLRQQVFGSKPKITDYAGEFFYEGDTLKFVNHEEGRAVMTSQVPAYEYFLKDHLGNVRVSFKAITEMTELKTNFEEASNTAFKNYPPDNSAYRATLNEFDHTDAGTAFTRSQRLTGGPGLQIGVSKSYEVMAGDMFDIEVFAKFEASTSMGTDRAALFSALTAAFSLPTSGGTGLESFQARQAFSNIYGTANFIGDEIPYEDGTAPKAFLNYILFDENFVFQDFGFDQVDASAEGLSAPHDHLSLHVAVQKKGYLYIFISNENPVVQNVYFDDLKIVRHTYVENVNDYYPFGLTFNSYSRESSVDQKYKFQGQEHIDDLDLGWDSFKWRNHDPAIGRFFNIDPIAEDYYYNSPYAFSENKVTTHVEIEGLEAQTIHEGALKQEIKEVEQAVVNTLKDVAKVIEDVVTEIFTQHHEDIEEVTSVNEEQTDPQTTDTKWTGNGPPLFNKKAVAKDGQDNQVMVTEGGQTKTEGGRPKAGTHTHEVKNTTPVDTTGTTGNVGPNGELYNSYYVTQGQDTLDNRHYVPDNLMPKKTTKAKSQN